MQTLLRTICTAGLLVCLAATARADKPIPAHPDKLQYPPLHYKVPSAAQFREVLPNGLVAYVAEDRLLPIFNLQILIRTGGALDPANKAGLASLAGEQMRDGGTQSLSPEELDERLAFLAADLSSRIGDTRGRISLRCLSKDIDAGLELLVDLLRYPRFDEARLRLAKERMIQNVKRRNDSTESIIGIEWGFLMDGDDHFSNRYPSSESIAAITQEDLFGFHRRFIHPGNMMLAVTGDFDRAEMLGKLQKAFGDWPVGEPGPKTFAKPTHTPAPGVYLIPKDDVNQGRVTIGHKSIMRGTPDEFALKIMNGILGGAGFSSRLLAKVRSDEGLAYSVWSRFEQGAYYPGDFQCGFQSKSNSCAYAAKLVVDEIQRLRSEEVSKQDLDTAVAYFVESFPTRFHTKMALLSTYLGDEYTGRDPAYWETYVDNLGRVSAKDVHRVAQKYLHPDKLVIVAVGETEALRAGGHDKDPDLRLDALGTVINLPLRDPDTLKR